MNASPADSTTSDSGRPASVSLGAVMLASTATDGGSSGAADVAGIDVWVIDGPPGAHTDCGVAAGAGRTGAEDACVTTMPDGTGAGSGSDGSVGAASGGEGITGVEDADGTGGADGVVGATGAGSG